MKRQVFRLTKSNAALLKELSLLFSKETGANPRGKNSSMATILRLILDRIEKDEELKQQIIEGRF